jgi:hypothetical protein
MLQPARVWTLLGVMSALCLATGYALHEPKKKGGDILDAVAAVQRRHPLYLIPERGRPYSWVTDGGFYLCRTGQSAEELDRLIKDPRCYQEQWHGIVYFKAYARRSPLSLPFLPGPEDRVLDYGGLVVYGDPSLIQEVRSILADQGFETLGS